MGLISVVAARLSQALLLLLAMSLIGFIGIHSVGNPVFNVVNIETATPEDIGVRLSRSGSICRSGNNTDCS